MTIAQLKEQIRTLPAKPGIYLFSAKGGSAFGGKDYKGKPLYIGKALNLKNRIIHYLKTAAPKGSGLAQNGREQFFPIKSGFLEVKPDNEVRCIVEQ